MQIILDHDTSLTHDADWNVYVTRPNFRGKRNTQAISSEYTIFQIAEWMHNRMTGKPCKLIQDAFPNMSLPDREFLISGTTADEWDVLFPKEEEEAKSEINGTIDRL